MIAEDAAGFALSPAGTLGLLYASLTNVCNARCSYCDVHETLPRRGAHGPHEIAEVLSDARGLGCSVVHFMGGGEPLVSRDFLPAVDACNALGMAIALTTNGFHLADRVAAMSPTTDIRSVLVSIDSHVAAEHDAVRRVPGLWQRAVDGLRALDDRFPGARRVLNHVVSRDNIDQSAAFIRWAATIGADAVNWIPVKDHPELSPTDAQVATFAHDGAALRAMAADLGIMLLNDEQDARTWASTRTESPDVVEYRCLFPEHAMYVDFPTGAVFPCDCTVHRKPEERFALGNVWEGGLTAAWHGKAIADLRRVLASPCDPGCKADCDWNNRRSNRVLIAMSHGQAA